MIIAGVITIGTAFAETFTELIVDGPATVNGIFRVNDAGFKVVRNDDVQTSITLVNSLRQSTFLFLDQDDNQRYIIRNTPGPEGKFQFLDNSGVSPTQRVDISIKRSTGNVGIGTGAPTELLDVNGNLRVRGNIVSTGDLCIGNCP